MSTLQSIAQKAGVSISTVRRALYETGYVSQDVKQRVLDIAQALRYVPNGPARSLKNQATKIIAVIIPDLTNPIYPEICNGVHDEAKMRGYQILYGNSYDNPVTELDVVKTFHESRVDGLILFPICCQEHPDLSAYLRDIQRSKVPVVLNGREVSGFATDSIRVQDTHGAAMAIRYLLRLGHRKIAFVGGRLGNLVWQNRLQGYKQALAEYEVAFDERYVITGQDNKATGFKAAQQLLAAHDDITAIFGGNDMIAIGAFQAVRELQKRVPEDISIVGFDDIERSSVMYPTLTTVSQPKYELGRKAAQMLIDRIEDKAVAETPESITLECVLKVRESSAPVVREPKS